MKFTDLNLSNETLRALNDMRFVDMTPIQEAAIPILLEGQDLIGQADTGTGKTAAFAIPTIETLDPNSKEIQALIMCPTRELCCQVAKQFSDLMKHRNGAKCIPIYGGQKINIQLKALRQNPQVIVGTPGRLLDHIRRGSLKLRSVKTVILDEADQMLGMGFKEDIESILKNTEGRSQTILFSATMQSAILQLAQKHQKKAQHINLKKKQEQAPKIKQIFCKVDSRLKIETIKRLLYSHEIKSALIFCNTRRQVDKLTHILNNDGFSVDKIHGEIKQNRRDAVMKKFRQGEIKILIATDVAARGIDVDNICAVFNYDLPRDSEDFVHRIGRTGRAGKAGLAFSLIQAQEFKPLKRIADRHKFTLNEQTLASMKNLNFSSLASLQNFLIDSTLSKHTSKKHLKMIRDLQEQSQEEKEIIKGYLKNVNQSKSNIFGLV